MLPKRENTLFTKNKSRIIVHNFKVVGHDSRVDTTQREDSPRESKNQNNVIPFRLKNSSEAGRAIANNLPNQAEKTSQSQVYANAAQDAKATQGLIVKQVLNRAIDDLDFWVDLLNNGSIALSEFNLSNEAKAAIASGDVQWVYDNVADIQESEMAFLYGRLERSV